MIKGTTMGVIKGATRSLDYGFSHQPRGQHLFACVCYCGGRGWEQEQGLPDGNHVLLGWRRKPQTVGKAVAQNPQKTVIILQTLGVQVRPILRQPLTSS